MQEPTSAPPSGAPPKPPSGALQIPAESDVHLLDRLAIVYRYRYIAVTVFVLTTAAVMIQGYTSIRMYEARVRLLIENERSTAIPGLTSAPDAYYEDPEPYYETQYKILRGRELARRVIKKLKLETVPEFTGTAEAPSWLAEGRQRIQRMFVSKPAVEAPRVDETPDESEMISRFLGNVSVSPIRGSRLVDVLYDSPFPQFAADAANALVEEYVSQNLELKQESTENMLAWLDKELAAQQKKVEDSERALAEYRDKKNALSLDDKQNIVLSRLNKLNDDVMAARTKRAQKDVLYSQIKAAAGAPMDSIPLVQQNPQVQAAKSRVVDTQRERARLAERYGEKHPELQKANAALEEAQRQYQLEVNRAVQSIKNDYDTAVLEERTLAGALDAAKADAQDLSRKSVDYNIMEREAKSNRQIFESLLQREKELRVSSNSRANNVRIVDRAETPRAPMTPGGRRTWLIALAAGLGLSFGVVFGLDYVNDTIKTPEDVARHLKLPFLGLVPSVRGNEQPVLASARPPHDFSESFRTLRTALISRYPERGAKIMLVTSAQPLEGKTTTACNIAMAIAYGGARVLLIDADMRRPGLHRPLRLTNERGLSQVLIGQARVRDVIQRTVDPNLLAITAGRTPPNPSELLASERMKTLLTNLANGPFDWIIIDSPPVLAVTDAVILAPVVSGVTFVIGAEMTRRRLAEHAVQTLMDSRPHFIAAVLNKVDFARNKYYYSRYYGHQYKNYYAEAV